jgi:hypothetical protein
MNATHRPSLMPIRWFSARPPMNVLTFHLLLCMVAGRAVLADPAPRPPHTWQGVERVVAVGDVHGDHEQFVKALRLGGVINDEDNWVGGRTHLVQLGDILDRGPDSRRSMDMLMKLEDQALRAGGRVHALIGNHEAMVLLRDYRYIHPGEDAAFGGRAAYLKAMSAEGVYGRWIRSHNTVIKINDVLFVHGGLAPWHAGLSLDQINDAVRQDLQSGSKKGLAMNSGGPLWYRKLATDPEAEVAAALDPVLRARGAARIVVGHTVSKDGIQVRAGGRVIMVDVGMAAAYGGRAACLVMENGVFTAVYEEERVVLEIEPPEALPEAA